MATRKAQVIIEVDDKSLQELNQEIVQLESSIKNLKIGTQEWNAANQKLGTLKTKFAAATQEATKLQNVIVKGGISESIRGIAKLGAGLVGTFTAVSGAIKLAGGDSKNWDEMTAKAATLMSIMGGLNQVAEMFGKDTMGMLKSIGTGFGQLVRTVKTASTGMKAALISTGIGALVVGVGLLIANFDKLINLVNGKNKKEKQGLENNLKLSEANQKLEEERAKTAKSRLELSSQLLTAERKAALATGLDLDAKNAALQTEKDRQALLQNEYDKIKKNNKEKNVVARAEKQAEIDLTVEKQKQLELDIQILEIQKTQATLVADIADSQKKYTDAIAASENKVIELNAQLYKSQEIFNEELKILDTKIAAAWDKVMKSAAGTSIETLAQIDNLESQRKALISQETIRKNQLRLDIQLLNAEIERNRQVEAYNNTIFKTNLQITDITSKMEDLTRSSDKHKQLIDLINQGYEAGKKIEENIVNFDLKRNKILKERTDVLIPSEVKLSNEAYQTLARYIETFGESIPLLVEGVQEPVASMQDLGKAIEIVSANLKTNLLIQGGINREYESYGENGKKIIDYATEDLALKKITAQIVETSLANQTMALERQREEAIALQGTYSEILRGLLEQEEVMVGQLEDLKTRVEITKNEEERYALLQEISKIETDLQGIRQEQQSVATELNNAGREQTKIEQDLLDVEYERKKNAQDLVNAQTEIAESLTEQLRISALLQDFTKKYGEEIQVTAQLINQSFEMIAAFQDRKAAEAQERIDEANKQLEELDKAEEERVSKLEEYEELLKDANGDRYDELFAKIQEEKQKKQAADNETEANRQRIEAQIKDDENKKLAAEARAAKWRKAQALIDAVIQGALAVIKALPNVFLAVATGVLAAAGVATIAAQKTPDVPKGYATGGFTPKTVKNDTPVGIVHGNEYVAPAFVTQSPEAAVHIAALERQRLRGYETGGVVTPNVSTGSGDFIDYDRLGNVILNGIMKLPNPQVSVLKITQAQNEVKLTKKLAGL